MRRAGLVLALLLTGTVSAEPGGPRADIRIPATSGSGLYPFPLDDVEAIYDPSNADTLLHVGYTSGGTTTYLHRTGAIVSAYPFTVSFWFHTSTNATTQSIFGMADEASGNEEWRVAYAGASDDKIYFYSRTGGVNAGAATANTVTDGNWRHVLVIATSATDRAIVLDGVWASRGTSVTSSTPTGLDNTTLGAVQRSTVLTGLSGKTSSLTVWAAVPADPETVAGQLAAGADPRLVAIESLVAHYPFSPTTLLTDEQGGTSFTEVGSPTGPTGAVFGIADLSGNGRHLMQGVTTAAPVLATVGSRTMLDFVTSDFLSVSTTMCAAAPYTVVLGFDADSESATGSAWSACDLSDFDEQFEGLISGASAGDPIGLYRRTSATNVQEPVTTDDYAADTFYSGTWVVISSTEARVRRDNSAASEGHATITDLTPANVDTFAIGAEVDLNPGSFFDGQIGRVVVFSVAAGESLMAQAHQWVSE